jgi:hypothetical protein
MAFGETFHLLSVEIKGPHKRQEENGNSLFNQLEYRNERRPGMKIRASYVRYIEGKSETYPGAGWFEPYTDDKKRLFASLQKEYGRCVSKMYVDVPMGDGTFDTRPCGWVFSRKGSDGKTEWEDETWVEYREDNR